MRHLIVFYWKKILLMFSFLSAFNFSDAQKKIKLSFEAGLTYFSNNAEYHARHLADFITITLNPRMVLLSTENSGVALEMPVSLRKKFTKNDEEQSGLHLPLLITYNTGIGSGGNTTYVITRKPGFTAGFGWGYFFQDNRSSERGTVKFDESLRSCGPEIQAGLRLPLKKKVLLFSRDKPAGNVLAIKANYLLDIKKRNNNIGAVSVLYGFHL